MVENIHARSVTVRDQRGGRGVSIVGGRNITYDHVDTDGTAGAEADRLKEFG